MSAAKTGGILKGRKHAQCGTNGCGIKIVTGTEHREAEGGEFLLNAKPLKNKKVITLTGTKRQIAEQINGISGIVDGKQTLHTEPGQYVINAAAMIDNDVFTVTGTSLQIASAINADKGYGIDFTPGATIKHTTIKLLGRDMKIKRTNQNIMATKKKTKNSKKSTSKKKPQKLKKEGSTSLAGKTPLQRKLIVELRAIHDLQFDFSNAGSMREIMENNEITHEQFTGKPSGLDIENNDASWVMFNSLWKKIMAASDNLTDEQIAEFYENGNGQYFEEELTEMEVDLAPYEADNFVQFPESGCEPAQAILQELVSADIITDENEHYQDIITMLASKNNNKCDETARILQALIDEGFIDSDSPFYDEAVQILKKKLAKGGLVTEKLFLVTDNNPDFYRRAKPVERPESFIRKNWDLSIVNFDEDNDDNFDPETLGEFLTTSSRGSTWTDENEEETFENIGTVQLAKGGPTGASSSITVEPYNEENFPSYDQYLKKVITANFGPENDYPGSASWGGIPVWGVNSEMYEGNFIIIDDNSDVILMTRKFNDKTEEDVDEDLMRIDAPSFMELDNGTSEIEKKLLALFQKAYKLKTKKVDKKSETKSNTGRLAKGGPVTNPKLQAQINKLQGSIDSPSTDPAMRVQMQAVLDKLKDSAAAAKPASQKAEPKPASKQDRADWERQVIDIIIEKQAVTNGDAQGMLEAFENETGMVTADWKKRRKPSATANKIMNGGVDADDENEPAEAKFVVGELVKVKGKGWIMEITDSTYNDKDNDWAYQLDNSEKGSGNGNPGTYPENELQIVVARHQPKSKTPKTESPITSGKSGADQVKYVDKQIDNVINKTIYFKGNKGSWIQGKINNIVPTSKTKEAWNIEFTPTGAGQEMDAPMVSDKLTTNQVDQFLHGDEVKKYTITKPESQVIKDFNAAQAEIDLCHEEAKAARVKKQRANPPVKKKPAEILNNKISSLKAYATKRITKKDPKKVAALNKMLTRHEKELKDFFGKK